MDEKNWLQVVLWRMDPAGRGLRVWSWLLLLAPAAWIGGLAMRYAVTTRTWPETALNRPAVLRRAASEAWRRGIDTSGSNDSMELQVDPALAPSDHDPRQAFREWMRQNMPARALVAKFHDPHSKADLTAYLNPQGELTSFEMQRAGTPGCADDGAADDAKAREVYQRRFGRWPDLIAKEPLKREVEGAEDAGHRRYTWKVAVPELADVPLRLDVTVTCGEITEDLLRTEAPGPGAPPPRIKATGSKTLGVIIAIYFFVAIVWIAVRYVKRTLQHEIGQGRILLAGAIFALSMGMAVLDRVSSIRISGGTLPLPLLALIIAFGLSVVAALFGMAYAAAEGEVRELYPGTMTSLDALLSGRVFSRNTGASVLLGMALGGWLLLATQFAALPSSAGPIDTSELEFAFAKWPWLTALFGAPAGAVTAGVFAFLVPLALFHRMGRRWARRWAKAPLVAVFAATALGLSWRAPTTLAGAGQALWGVAGATTLFAAFFLASDLLAGLAALASLRLGLAAGSLLATSGASVDLLALCGAGAGVAVAAWIAAAKGPVLSDEEVRPAYAANLEERLRLEQELDATRLAQQRLLPASFPELEGMSVAGACLPAQEAAGDFYDAYALRSGNLAVFLAEGGGQRLARALSIALVKGYLMQKAENARSVGEALTALHRAFGKLVEGSTENLCLAVVDAQAMQLRYARTGASPTVLLRRRPAAPALPCAEAVRQVEGLHFMEGAATLEQGSLLLLYSDGIARRGSLARMLRRNRFEKRDAPLSAAEVVQAVLGRVSRRRRRRLKDDLTLLAVRVEGRTAASREGVA